jgi:hypothetical protein
VNGVRGPQGPRGPRGGQSNVTRIQLFVIFAVTVFAFTLVAVRTEIQQRQIDANSRRLAVVVHRQCLITDATAARQIALIDSALVAERRKPHPDRKRIADLEKFKPSRVDCG